MLTTNGAGHNYTQVPWYLAAVPEHVIQLSIVVWQVPHWLEQASHLLVILLGIVVPVGQADKQDKP